MMDRKYVVSALLILAFAYVFFSGPPRAAECDVLSGEVRDLCYINASLAREDPGLCTWVSEPEKQNMCFKGVAIDMRDAGVCDRISDSVIRDSCVLEVARISGDSSVCGRIFDSSIRDECIDSS